ncbi:hypothetical protein PWR63_23785 [Paraburkholderia sp. A2WS-5]|uniref:HNH endonuclease n=1 Tax=Paraburkholderia sp. A2WS-5 TaxID=3028372 RepID=UPI003B806279
MADENRYGLSRRVPAGVRREVRRRCGFGCVICGLAYYDYEHFDPDFVDAREHNPAGMTLLCPNCNQKRARGRLSADTVATANANPKCLQQGFASELLDFASEPIDVKFAGVSFYDCRHLIVVNGIPILSVAPPAEPGLPMRLSGIFTDDTGRVTLKIDNNRFSVNPENWDVECTGPRIRILSARGEVALHLEMDPPNGIAIEQLNMSFGGAHLRGNSDILELSIREGQWNQLQQVSVARCHTGIAINVGPAAANDPYFEVEE